MADEVLILGATGRTGRGIARILDAAGVPLALYGRDSERLKAAAAELEHTPAFLTGSMSDQARLFSELKPKVVVSTVGPFTTTAAQVIDALPAGTHYVDIANEYASFDAVFSRHEQAITRGQTLVPGAGFGVISTESPLLALLADAPTPARVRVDALPSVALEAGKIGDALAGSIVDSMPLGRRQVRGGRLINRPFDDTALALSTPDDQHVTSVNFTSGDLLTAWKLSGADEVLSGSCEVPSGAAIRYALPLIAQVTRSRRVRGFMAGQMAKVQLKDKPKPRPNSWGHADVTWPDGTHREAWLRVEDAMDYTCAGAAAVAQRVAAGGVELGAHTPCALFGSGFAAEIGAELIL